MNASGALATKDTAGKRRANGVLSRQDWLDAAREMLIQEGIERVKIEPLAERLGISRGSFYWHFADRQALLDALLDWWKETALEPMRVVAHGEGLTPLQRYDRFMRAWVQGEPAYPIYDLAIRRWAMVSPKVAVTVKQADDARVKLLKGIFEEMGFDEDEAFIRARIAYFHQIGYYATNVRESRKTREKYWPLYLKIMAGQQP